MIARAASTGGDARRDAHDFAAPSRPSASRQSTAHSSTSLSSIEQTLASEGVLVSTTSGRSMLPMLRNRRDTIVIRPAESARPGGLLRRFDVALYCRPDGAYVLHRVIRVLDNHAADVTYLIRGDNTFVLERVPADWVIGVLEECWRGNRHLNLSGWRYRAYCRIWNAIFPIRRIAHAMRGTLARTPLRTVVRALRSLAR